MEEHSDGSSVSSDPVAVLPPSPALRAVLDRAPMVMWMLDPDGVFTFSEGKALEAVGLEPGEMVGRSVWEAYAAYPEILEEIRRALAGEERASVARVGGIWFESRYAPLRAADGEIRGMVGVAIDVTERQAAEAELARSVSLLRAAFESTADGLLVVGAAGEIVTHNRRMAELWRIPEEVFATGRDEEALRYVLEQLRDPEVFLAQVERLYADPEAQSFDVLEFRDGRIFERYSQPQRIGAEVVGRVWSFRDVTERRRAEEALRRREAQLARTQEIAGLGSWEWRVEEDAVWWSDEMFRIYGLEPGAEEVTVASFLRRVHPEDRAPMQERIGRSLESHEPFRAEHRIVRPDGSVRTLHAMGEVVCDERGRVVRMLGTGQDVTERKAASEALRVSENRFRTMFEQFPFSIQIFAPDGSTLQVNEAWSEFFGLTAEQLGSFNPLTEPQLADIAAYIRRAFSGESVSVPATLFDARRAVSGVPEAERGEMDAHWIQAFMCPVKDADGGIREVFVVHQDVTPQKHAEEVLLRSNEELERLVEERTIELAETNAALEEEIAERERAEEDLREKTNELEAIFRALPDSYIRLTAEGMVVQMKAGSGSILRQRPEECCGRDVAGLLPAGAVPAFRRALASVRETGQLARVEYETEGEDARSFEARLVPLSGEEIIAIVRDVTDRREAERALRRSEEHFRRLIENSSDVATILAPDGTNLYQSPSITGVLGYAPEEMVGTRAFDRIHPEDVALAATALRAAVEKPGTAASAEFRYRHKSGAWRYLESRAKTLDPASADSGVVVNSRDVTERHQMEEALHRREEHFRRLIENGTDLIEVIDPKGRITYASPSIQRALGYTPEEVVGHRVVDVTHPDDLPQLEMARREIVKRPGTTLMAEYRARHKNGSWRVFEGLCRTLNPTSAEEGLVANSRDITERKRIEEALRYAMQEAEDAREAAEQANRAKSEFLSRMSHELRTPLNSILGFGQVLARKEIPPDQRKAVDHILKAGRHLLNLINEVLDISRIETNRQELSLEPVQARGVLQEALSLVQPLAAESGTRIDECEIRPEWYVRADRQRLTQVLLNLLSNAIKYNQPGGRVRLLCQEVPAGAGPGGSLRIGVSDTGPGIPPERMGELFTPFARLGAEQTNVEGTGLGLALSQRLAQAMSGTLTVESEVGRGSTFWVELPRSPSPLEQWTVSGSGEVAPIAAPREARTATLLYIEDNLANYALIEAVLASRPEITLLSALQGRLGLELAWKHHPDLILLDLHLPDLSGSEVIRRLRGDPRTRQTPVVMVSADATLDSVERLRAQGAQAYLTKPIDVGQLLETVDALLTGRPTLAEDAQP